MDTLACGEKTGSEPDDYLRQWGDSKFRNASKGTYFDPGRNEVPKQDAKRALSSDSLRRTGYGRQ